MFGIKVVSNEDDFAPWNGRMLLMNIVPLVDDLIELKTMYGSCWKVKSRTHKIEAFNEHYVELYMTKVY